MNNQLSMFFGASPQLFEYAKQLRGNETLAEQLLWARLSNGQLHGLRFRRQHPIKYFIADFYCHKIRLVIEVDGGIHSVPQQFEYDQNRSFELELLDMKVVRFTNEEVLENIDGVVVQIGAIVLERIVSIP